LNLKGLRAPIDNSGGSPYSRSARYARPGCSKDSLWLWIQAIAAVAVRPARDAPHHGKVSPLLSLSTQDGFV
jgi:hypothetical protein